MGFVVRALTYVGFTLVFAWLARRVLGAHRVSWGRAVLAGVAGVIVGAALGGALIGWDVNDDSAAFGAAIVTALLVTMGLIVALQLISRPAAISGPSGGIVGSVRVARRTAVGIFALSILLIKKAHCGRGRPGAAAAGSGATSLPQR